MAGSAGYVITVLGQKEPGSLGITLSHEHLNIEFSVMYQEPEDPEGKRIACSPITLKNLGWVLYNPFRHIGNLSLRDEDMAVEEVMRFKAAGGGTIVDCTTLGIGRNPEVLKRISQRTGIKIVCGTGYYVYRTHPEDMDSRSVESLREEMVKEIEEGIGKTGIRAGLVGEIGNSFPWHENEKKVCKAAVAAQLEAGASLSIHPGRDRQAPLEILRFLRKGGARLDRVIMCHLDRTIDGVEEFRAIASFGCYLEMDLFGYETYYPLSNFPMPNDAGRIKIIKALIKEGYIDRILISHDIAFKTRWSRFGGYGLEHILKNIVPRLYREGISKDEVEQILVSNPINFLTINKA